MFRVTQAVFDFISVAVWSYNRFRFRALASPFQVVQVPVSQIKLSLEPSRYVRRGWYRINGTIRRKEWDRLIPLPEKHNKLVQKFEGAIQEGGWCLGSGGRQRQEDAGSADWFEGQGELQKYRGMYHEFRAGKFRVPQRWGSSQDPFCVCIGADGEFIFTTGKHRLALAKAAGLERIPARISARHVKWQKLRESVVNDLQRGLAFSEVYSDLGHPDFFDIVKKMEAGSARL